MDDEYFIKVCNSSTTMREASIKLGINFTSFKRKAQKLGCYKTNQAGKGVNKPKPIKYDLKDILEGNHPTFQTFKLKKRMIKAGIKNNICELCGLEEWQGKKIEMELHHINGNNKDHRLVNLQMICPNCHSQTKNFRGLNKKKGSVVK